MKMLFFGLFLQRGEGVCLTEGTDRFTAKDSVSFRKDGLFRKNRI